METPMRIKFIIIKNGTRRALSWSKAAARWLPIAVAAAEFAIATGSAVNVAE